MLKEKTKAPDFRLLDTEENEISLSDFLGKKVVLYFYPKDNTPGWTKQACVFAGVYDIFEEKNVIVIGVSKDSVKSHKKFKEKNKLPFILLSDKDGEVVKAYDVWNEKKIFGKIGMGISRTTYIIDEKGIIEKVMPKVKPDTNAIDILNYLDE